LEVRTSIPVRTVAVALATLAFATLGLVARADGFVYFPETGLGTIGRANLNGTGVNLTFISGLDQPQGMAVDSAHIYWVTPLATVARANLDGTGVDQSFIFGAFGAKGVAVDSAHIYWTNSGPNGNGIGRANLDGTGVNQRFISTAVPATGVAADGAHVYWSNSGLNTIGRANLDGTGANQTFITGAQNPLGVAVDSAHLYWANGSSATIGRANLDGLEANEFFIFAGSPQAVAVDGAHVWWSNGRPFYAIGQANLDGTSVNQRFFSTLSAPSGVAVDALAAPAPGPGPGPPTITRLVADVQGLGLPRGIERGLLAKLGAAQRNVDAGDLEAACGSLGAYSNQVHAQSDHTLDGDQAAELIAEATAIRELLGCSAG
jgi:virginiamycin B lyase